MVEVWQSSNARLDRYESKYVSIEILDLIHLIKQQQYLTCRQPEI